MSDLLKTLRENFRLRLGLWVVIIILASYPVLWLRDYQRSIAAEYHNAVVRFQRLQVIRTQQDWVDHAREAESLRTELETKLWHAESNGLAQAMLQAWLQEQVKALEIGQGRVNTETGNRVEGIENLWKMTAKCDGLFVPKQFEQFLQILAAHPQWLTVEHLEIRTSFNISRFTMLITAYFQIPPESNL